MTHISPCMLQLRSPWAQKDTNSREWNFPTFLANDSV